MKSLKYLCLSHLRLEYFDVVEGWLGTIATILLFGVLDFSQMLYGMGIPMRKRLIGKSHGKNRDPPSCLLTWSCCDFQLVMVMPRSFEFSLRREFKLPSASVPWSLWPCTSNAWRGFLLVFWHTWKLVQLQKWAKATKNQSCVNPQQRDMIVEKLCKYQRQPNARSRNVTPRFLTCCYALHLVVTPHWNLE